MASAVETAALVTPSTPVAEVSLVRLYVMRLMYLVLALGIGALVLPTLIKHGASTEGLETCLLGGIGVLAIIGLRYPLQMIPLLMFEFVWKAMWVLDFGLPKLWANQLTPDFAYDLKSTMVGVILMPLVIPWGYVWHHYVQRTGDRWK
ncbi:MAG TPA: hypothetical protein VFW35_04290 [Sphingomicrobium sp.]|nr:hypothetical protein [Sphingomicrobium sp.]